MTTSPFPLSSYLQRIAFSETPQPTLACLKRIHRKHQENIPFENLDVLLGRSISIELDDIFQKLVIENRGGYCFEQNSLLAAALREIGFQVTPYIARVRWLAPENVATPLSHMVLRVETEAGPQLADVGFGGIGLVEPIALDSREEQHRDFEPRRIIERDSQLVHQVKISDDWKDVYQLIPTPAPQIDLEVGNWYSHTHPKAHFRNALVVAKLTKTGRIIIANTESIERNWNDSMQRTSISNQRQLRQILSNRFSLDFDKDTLFEFPGLDLPNK